MTDAELLLVVIGALYLFESLQRARGDYRFERTLRGRWRAARPEGLRAGNPLPFLCEQLSLRDGLISGDPARRSTDPESVRQSIRDWRDAVTELSAYQTLQFFYTFAVAPTACLLIGFAVLWKTIFATVVALDLITATFYFRAHRKLHPAATGERWERVAMILVSPATSMRASSTLRPAIADEVEPLMIAALLLDRPAFASFARRRIIDVRRTLDAVIEAASDGYRGYFESLIEQSLQLHALDVDKLFSPPAPESDGCMSWCQRCEAQFTAAARVCGSCGDLPVTSLRT
jgi:hypothetical protein